MTPYTEDWRFRALMPRPVVALVLGVEVHHQHLVVELGQRGAEVHRRGGLPHAALWLAIAITRGRS